MHHILIEEAKTGGGIIYHAALFLTGVENVPCSPVTENQNVLHVEGVQQWNRKGSALIVRVHTRSG